MKWGVEPFEIYNPRETFCNYPEIVSEQQASKYVNRVMSTGDDKPNTCNCECDKCGGRELDIVGCLEFAHDDD